MKKIFSMMMIAAVAMMSTACDKDDEGAKEYTLSGTEYTGALYGMGSPQSDVVVWVDKSDDGATVDVMFPALSFVPNYMPELDMAFVDVPKTTEGVYGQEDATMVGITDHLPLINDVVQEISNLNIIYTGADIITVTFTCTVVTEYFDGEPKDVDIKYTGTIK
ncbi:MAG: hypothetical protein SNG14_04020 [Rikenellaceae bacterium]